MKKVNPALYLVLLIVFVSSALNALTNKDNPYKHGNKSIPVLKMVFVDDKDTLNKTILKLYDNESYEFLNFKKIKNRITAKRELGDYVLEGVKLKLEAKNEKSALEHPTHFYYSEEKGLFEKKREMESGSNPMFQKVTDDKIYREPFYVDSVFGKISNNYKVFNKLNDPEWAIQERKEKEEQEEIRIKREAERMDSIYKSSLIKDSLDLVMWQSETKKLKAVIIVSDVDGDEPDGWWNKEYIAEQKKNAKYLREHGVLVKEFYHPNTKWKDIVKASNGANIFIYSGHGSNQGINHDAGGLCLVDGIWGAESIMNEIKLHKNALVFMNSACSSAGSSASDVSDIGYKEAQLRAGEYAYPFLFNSSGAYIADCNTGEVIKFFNMFFKGKSLVEIYNKVMITDEKIEPIVAYNYLTNYNVCVSSRPVENRYETITTITNGKKSVKKVKEFKGYHLAYVSPPNYTIRNLMK
jgi:hypothetical protein